jgi:hypothetical protein
LQTFAYSGQPDTASPYVNSPEGDFYVIFRTPPQTDAEDRRVCVAWLPWDWEVQAAGGIVTDIEMRWYAPYSSVTWQQIWKQTGYSGGGGWDYLVGATLARDSTRLSVNDTALAELVYTPGVGGWTCCRIYYIHILLAALSVFHVPHGTITDGQYLYPASWYAPGRVIGMPNVGDLFHSIGTASSLTEESLERLTARALFQYGTPVSVQTANNIWTNIYRHGQFKYATRRLTNAATITARPAVVVDSAADGDQVRFTTSNGQSWTWTSGGAILAPLPIYSGALLAGAESGPGIVVDNTALEDCWVEVRSPTSSTIGIRTVALFEDYGW